MCTPSPTSPSLTHSNPPPLEVLSWPKSMPMALEYHPTVEEFQDPIAYISKIEDEASLYGICKIIPPIPAPSLKSTRDSLNCSFTSTGKKVPSFRVREQQIGVYQHQPRPAQRSMCQSKQRYTLQQFEAGSRQFEKTQMKKWGNGRTFTPMEVETLFWKASADKPFTVNYANDIPGSGFVKIQKDGEAVGGGRNVGGSAWNMREVSRVDGSLLRFIERDVPGVTSPMVYVGMMFSWFAWHMEDHELHSLNYLHFGPGKIWYGVPRDARFALEEVVQEHGYGGGINPLVVYSILSEKTTIMSPEILLGEGVPCCRLVQNPGEFVVTFPGAYHCGFSLGFTCGEALNIATPAWLKGAKDAAIRRASANLPPMLSHIQLLYEYALSLHSRMPSNGNSEPRSSRLKEKKKGKGETIIKELFVRSVIQSNNQLSTLLGEGSCCVLLPRVNHDGSTMHLTPKMKVEQTLPEQTEETSRGLSATGFTLKQSNLVSAQQSDGLLINCSRSRASNLSTPAPKLQNRDHEEKVEEQNSDISDQGLLPCATCGILSFSCMAVIQPTEAAAIYLMSTDCSSFSAVILAGTKAKHTKHVLGEVHKNGSSMPFDKTELSFYGIHSLSSISGLASEGADPRHASALIPPDGTKAGWKKNLLVSSQEQLSTHQHKHEVQQNPVHREDQCDPDEMHTYVGTLPSPSSISLLENNQQTMEAFIDYHSKEGKDKLSCFMVDPLISPDLLHHSEFGATASSFGEVAASVENPRVDIMHIPDKDSLRMHIFCLEHAIEVKKRLQTVGGAHVMLLCHPDYPEMEIKAKSMAEELRIGNVWKVILFKEANNKDKERIQSAFEDEDEVPVTGDWSVKMGINLYYTTHQYTSPSYSKNITYNAAIYKAFNRHASVNSPQKPASHRQQHGWEKKPFVAGKWCGKIWMSNQVHRHLAYPKEHDREQEEEACKQILVDPNHDLQPGTSRGSLKVTKAATAWSSRIRKNRKKRSSATKLIFNEMEASKSNDDSAKDTSKPTGVAFRDMAKKHRVSPVEDNLNKLTLDLEYDTRSTCTQFSQTPSESEVPESSSDPEMPEVIKMAAKPGTSETTKMDTEKSGDNEQPKKVLRKILKPKQIVGELPCEVEGCPMSFSSSQHLSLHKQDICHVDGCNKQLFSHKYLLQHSRVHLSDRPLKCPWEGCNSTFKWPWARTEHQRVHTGECPYVCLECNCNKTFRFISDFSRHQRKTGHISKNKKAKISKK